jgi:hypothetical protein
MALPARIPLLLFLFFTLFYFVTMPGYLQVSDSGFSLRTAQALVQRGTLEIENTAASEGYVFLRDGRAFSKFGIGLALIWVPFVALADGVIALTGLPAELVTHFVVSTFSIFFGAAACVLFSWLASAFGVGKRHAVRLTLVFGLGTIVWKYSVFDFSEIVQAVFLLGATLAAWRNTPRAIAVMTVMLSFNVWTKVAAAIYVPLFLSYVAVRNRRDLAAWARRFAIAAAVGAVFVGGLLYLNWLRFGHPLESGYGEQAAMFSATPLRNAAALLFSVEKGAFLYSPILLFGLAGFPLLWARHRAEAGLLAALIAVSVGFHALYVYYEGGWCWGPRFLVPVTFALLLPAGLLLDRRPALRPWFLALAIVSGAVQVLGVAVKDQEYLTLRNVLHQDRATPLPSPIVGHAVVLRHKLTGGGSAYAVREFGVHSDAVLDTTEFSTFQGFNLWYFHVARGLGREAVKLAPLAVLPFLVWLWLSLWRAMRRAPIEDEDE